MTIQETAAEIPAAPSAPALDVRYLGVLLCFVLSGFAALLYQTAWMREFSIVFGTSELAVAAVLASYMAGLALGAAVAGRFARRVRRPILVYGLLELGVALGALAVPLGLYLARTLLVAVLGGQAELPDSGGLMQPLFYLASAFLVVLVPTACMGATLPLLARHAVRREEQIGRRVGTLYALNTAGAVLGTLVAAFVLLPSLGLGATVLVGVAVNAVVFGIAALLAWGEPAPGLAEPDRLRDPAAPGTTGAGIATWILPLMLVSGAVSFTYEVLWTRLLGHLLGASVYAFATMLASFLAGIAIGSAVAAWLARNRGWSWAGFLVAQLGTAGLSVAIWWLLGALPEWARAQGVGEHAGLWTNATRAAVLLLPATLCIGATFPFALRILARDEEDAGPAAARVYSWNTVGAICGAILAGFFVIPALGFADTARLAVMVNLLLAVATGVLLLARRSFVPLAVAGVAALAGLLAFRPTMPESLLRMSPFRGLPAEGELVYSAVGRTAAVLVLERDGHFDVRCNGLPEAEVAPRGAPPFGRQTHAWLTTLPVLARPGARSMLVIGFGGGVSIEGVSPTVREIDSVELEPEVIEANRVIADRRLKDPLKDPRLNLVLNDARGALSLTDERWDAIVSQPSHPWTAGASHLYTREFMRQVSDHLEENGVFVQWLSTHFVDEELFKTVGATLMDVFENVRLYRPIPTMLVFLASDGPLNPEHELAVTGEPIASAPEHFGKLGINDVNDLVAAFVLDHAGLEKLCAGAPINTDDDNRLAMRAPRLLNRPLRAQGTDALLLPLDPLLDPASELNQDKDLILDPVYLVRRMAHMSGYQQVGGFVRALRLAKAMPDSGAKQLAFYALYTVNTHMVDASEVGDQWQKAWQARDKAYEVDRYNRDARFAYLEPRIMLLLEENPELALVALADALPDPERAVVRAMLAGQKGDWRKIEEMDPVLAQARPRALCYQTACRVRASWRIQKSQAENDRSPAVEALQIVDRALAIEPDPWTFLVRLGAADQAGRVQAMIETANELGRFLSPGGLRKGTNPAARQLIRDSLRDYYLQRRFGRLARNPNVSQERVQEVVGKLTQLVQIPLEAQPAHDHEGDGTGGQ